MIQGLYDKVLQRFYGDGQRQNPQANSTCSHETEGRYLTMEALTNERDPGLREQRVSKQSRVIALERR